MDLNNEGISNPQGTENYLLSPRGMLFPDQLAWENWPPLILDSAPMFTSVRYPGSSAHALNHTASCVTCTSWPYNQTLCVGVCTALWGHLSCVHMHMEVRGQRQLLFLKHHLVFEAGSLNSLDFASQPRLAAELSSPPQWWDYKHTAVARFLWVLGSKPRSSW